MIILKYLKIISLNIRVPFQYFYCSEIPPLLKKIFYHGNEDFKNFE